MRETIRKVAGPICLIIMIIEIVCGIMDSSMQAFIVAFLAGLMGVLYITDGMFQRICYMVRKTI